MTLKQVLAQSGIERTYRFNPFLDNWVTAMARAEIQGLQASAVRIGSKRVIISIDREFRSKAIWLPLLASLVILTLISGYLLLQDRHAAKVQMTKPTCLPLTIGDEIVRSGSEYQIRDWHVSFESKGKLGGLELLEAVASCDDDSWRGSFTVSNTSGELRLKKLAPTKK
jgi:hypothetical protein